MTEVPRRQFLKISGAIAAAACLNTAGLSGTAAAAEPLNEVSMLVDTSKCTGCRTCIIACNNWNRLKLKEFKFHTAREGRPRFSDHQWIDVAYNRYSSKEDEAAPGKMLYTRISCMHCRDAACVQVCPVGAIHHTAIGTVEIDEKRCIGCNYCIANCTFNVVGFNRALNIARKCTFCSDRLSRGMIPACVQACPTGTLVFGSRNRIIEMAEARVVELKKKGASRAGIYGLDELDGLGMLYVLEKGLENSETNYALPEDPQVPAAASAWGIIYKPIRSVVIAAMAFALWVNKGESRVKS